MADRVCSKCHQTNPVPIQDYCSVCGERASPMHHDARTSSGPRKTMEFSDKNHGKVAEISLSSSAGKSASEETKELMAFVRAQVDDAPNTVEEFSDGIAICKLIISIAPLTNPRYNPKPKMVLQKLNNVHLAVTTMESLGISTAGINTKDVVDGNEKQIMNILRGLFLFSKRSNAPSRRLSFSARDGQGVLPSASPALAASLVAPSPPAVVVTPPPVAATVQRPVAGPAQAPKSDDAMRGLAQLDVERKEHEAELRALEKQIAVMNAQLETLAVSAVPVAKPSSPSPPPVPRVVVSDGPAPRASRADSSTSGEEDSDDKEAAASAAAAAAQSKKDEVAERLKMWKVEEEEKKRRASEEKAAAEVRAAAAAASASAASAAAAAAAIAPPPPVLAVNGDQEGDSGSVARKKGRRRKKRAARKGGRKASASAPGGGGGSDDDDSGISDSPDGSEEDSGSRNAPHSPALSAAMLHQKSLNASRESSGASLPGASPPAIPSVAHSGTSSPLQSTPPPIPIKSDVVRERANSKKKAHTHKKRSASRADRINVAEAELDAAAAESAAVKELATQLQSQEALAAMTAGLGAAGQQASKWHVPAAKQEELKSRLGGNKVFLKGLARVQALHRANAARKKRKLLAKRVFIAREVVESEKSYVRNLGLCIDHFYKPMSELSYISDIQLRQIFSEISVIRGFNAHLCGQLEQRHQKWQACGQRMGDIFLSFVAYFRSYTAYVNNYNDAMSLFYQLQAKNKAFQAFLMEKKMDSNLNGQELPAFLIMPIQRLPRYVMLLEDLLRNTPKDHADFADLSTALAKVQEVADYVNEKKREAENINQVIDVQSRLSGMSKNLAEPHRRFVRQGAVLNADGKGETMLFLFNDILVTGKESSGLGKLAEKGKEMLGFKKGSSTPKMGRKAGMSPFFGKKKPQLQAEGDDREYRYQKTISLSDCKVTAQFGVQLPFGDMGASQGGQGGGQGGANGGAGLVGGLLSLKTPLDTLNFGTASEEELDSWLHDLDSTAMRLVERKRLRCERTAKHHEGAESVLVPVGGRSVVNKNEASFTGRLNLGNPDKGGFEAKYVVLIKPHMYVFNDAEDDKPQGWMYLLTSHVVLGTESDFPNGYSFSVHVPHAGDKPLASPWMVKHATRVRGHAGNPNSSVALDKEVVSEEDQDRDVYEFVGASANEALNWCREIRNVVLDAVKLPDDLCPLDLLQKNSAEENNVCADCNGGPTRYASINLGVFVCEACKEVHEEILEGISVIRDIREPWDISPQQRFELEALMGNAKRNKIFEKNATRKDLVKPRPGDSKDTRMRWIKAKYIVSGADTQLGGGGAGSTPSMRRLSGMGNTVPGNLNK